MVTVHTFILKMYGGPEGPGKYPAFIINLKKIKMKKIKILGLIVTLIIVIFSCEESKDPAGLRGVAVIPAITDINPAIFDSKDLENSYIEFKVDLLGGAQVDNTKIIGSYNGNLERIEIGEVTAFPSTVRISSSDVAQKLGIALTDIHNGEIFTFELVTTSGGKTTRSNAAVNVPVACAYDVNLATGSYHAVSDWPSEYDVTITADPDDPYTVFITDLGALDGCTEDNSPYVLHVNPIDYTVSTETKLLSSDYYGYGGITYSGNGLFSSCNGSYTLYIDISVGDYGSQGVYTFELIRNP